MQFLPVVFPSVAQNFALLMGAITNLSSVILPHRLLVVVHIENMNVLTRKDLELMERIVCKSADDIAVSIARSFERLEESMDAFEARIYSHLTDIEEELETELKALRLIAEGESEVVIVEK